MAEKCKASFEEKKPMISETAILTELQIFQSKILNIENDIKALNNKSDHTISSITYMANEYDDFAVEMANFASAKQSLSNEISDLTKKIEMFNKKKLKLKKIWNV